MHRDKPGLDLAKGRGVQISDEPINDGSTLRLVLGRWWLVAAVALLGMIGAYFLSQVRSPVYQSSAKFVLTTNPVIEDPSDVASALGVLRNRQVTTTFAELLQSATLMDRAVREVGGNISQFESSGVVLPESNVVSLTVSGPSSESAREVNAIIGSAARDEISSFYPIFDVVVLESPKTPTDAVSPAPARDALFGAMLGGFFGLVLAAVWPVPRRSDLPPLARIETVSVRESAGLRRDP